MLTPNRGRVVQSQNERLLLSHGFDYVWQHGRLVALMPVSFGPGEWNDVTDLSFRDMLMWLGY